MIDENFSPGCIDLDDQGRLLLSLSSDTQPQFRISFYPFEIETRNAWSGIFYPEDSVSPSLSVRSFISLRDSFQNEAPNCYFQDSNESIPCSSFTDSLGVQHVVSIENFRDSAAKLTTALMRIPDEIYDTLAELEFGSLGILKAYSSERFQQLYRRNPSMALVLANAVTHQWCYEGILDDYLRLKDREIALKLSLGLSHKILRKVELSSWCESTYRALGMAFDPLGPAETKLLNHCEVIQRPLLTLVAHHPNLLKYIDYSVAKHLSMDDVPKLKRVIAVNPKRIRSVKHLHRLHREWIQHQIRDAPDFEFPPPPKTGMRAGSLQIRPILSKAALTREGVYVNHCLSDKESAGQYLDQILEGNLYLYSVVGMEFRGTLSLMLSGCWGLDEFVPKHEWMVLDRTEKASLRQWLDSGW